MLSKDAIVEGELEQPFRIKCNAYVLTISTLIDSIIRLQISRQRLGQRGLEKIADYNPFAKSYETNVRIHLRLFCPLLKEWKLTYELNRDFIPSANR